MCAHTRSNERDRNRQHRSHENGVEHDQCKIEPRLLDRTARIPNRVSSLDQQRDEPEPHRRIEEQLRRHSQRLETFVDQLHEAVHGYEPNANAIAITRQPPACVLYFGPITKQMHLRRRQIGIALVGSVIAGVLGAYHWALFRAGRMHDFEVFYYDSVAVARGLGPYHGQRISGAPASILSLPNLNPPQFL